MKRKHYLLIAALSLSLTTAAAVTFTACKHNKVELIEILPSVAGTYYFDDAGTEKTLELGVNSFKLNFGNGVQEGGYTSYADGTLQLLFDNGETATAVFSSGTLTLTYKGATYVLYEKVDYTVQFNTDGGSAVAAQTVTNGRKATRPATNPTRENSIFIGWYTSDAYTATFNFDAPITGNTTIYAKFITIDKTLSVYEATFDLGDGVDASYGSVQTVNRVLYNLPEAPDKAGNKFLGWWISNYYDGTKLSTKYEEQVIYEDIVLYAVWASDTPAISVTQNGATWYTNGTNQTFDVAIKDASGNVLASNRSASTSIDFDFTAQSAGDYTVEVTVNGKTAIAYYRNKALARVAAFVVEDDYLGFLPIETDDEALVVNYYLDFECGDSGHHHNHQALSATGYDFSSCAIGANGYRARITAEAAGRAASVSEWYAFDRTLESVTGLEVDEENERLQWNPVTNALGYSIEFSNGTDTFTEYTTDTTYDLRSLKGGTWTIKVTPVNPTYRVKEAASVEFEKIRLQSPTNFVVTATAISWDPVDGATGYEVYVNGALQATLPKTTTSFAITDDWYTGEATEYAVTVIAKGEKESYDSLASDAVYIHGELGEITYHDGEVSWAAVKGIGKYGVKVGNAAEIFVSTNRANVVFAGSGVTEIVVTCYVNETEAADSNSTTVTVYTLIFNTKGGTSYSNQYKVAGDTVTLPDDVERLGYTFLGWYNQAENGAKYNNSTFAFDPDYATVYAYWEAKEYTITLSVDANGTLPDGAETELTVTFGGKLATPFPVPECKVEGQDFTGWYTAATGGEQITDNMGKQLYNWSLPYNTTLYAHWGNAGVVYELLNDHEYYATKSAYANTLTTITVRATYKGLPVTTIAPNAFQGCTAVKTLRLPSSLTTVFESEGEYASPYANGSSFFGMSSLENIEVYDVGGEHFFASVDGCLYSVANEELDELIYVPRTKNVVGLTFTVAEGAKRIGNYALSSLSELVEVVIPSSVTYIDKSAFQSDYKLTKVTFLPTANGELGEALEIAKGAFQFCTTLTSITFPKRLAVLSNEAFGTATGSTTPLQNVYIQELGETKDRNTNYYDIDGVLCKVDEIIMFPLARDGAYETPAGIRTIGEGAFQGVKNLTSITFLATVTEIKTKAFNGCSGLTSITFDQSAGNSDLIIRESAFYGCSKVRRLVLPPNLQTLEVNAFGNTSSLTEITVNTNRSSIDYATNAFAATTSTATTYLEVVNLGEFVPVIELTGVFGSKLREVHVDPKNPNYIEDDYVIYNGDGSEILFFPAGKTEFTFGAQMTRITANLFKNKTDLISVTIGGNIREIGASAFEGCTALETLIFEAGTESLTIHDKAFYNLKELKTLTFNGRSGGDIILEDEIFASSTNLPKSELTTITLPESVKKLGKYTFAQRNNLKVVNLPASLEEVGMLEVGDQYPLISTTSNTYKLTSIGIANTSIFTGCGTLETVNVAAGGAHFESIGGVLFAKEDGVTTTLLVAPWGNEGDKMPDELKDPNVEGDQYGYLEVPETVTKIADYAFYYNKVKRVVFKGDHTEFALGNNAFQWARELESISLPSGLKEIPEALFSNCNKLKEVEVPNTVTLVKQKAFANIDTLEKVTFAPGNDTVPLNLEDGTYSSVGGSSGTSYTITGAFARLKALQEVVLPARLQSIGNYSFCNSGNSTGIARVTIPATVTKIGTGAFMDCKKLETVTFTGVQTMAEEEAAGLTIGDKAFQNCAITEFAFPAHVTEIGANAFSSCKLTSLSLPEGLTSIGANAFSGCVLTQISLPSTLTTLGASAFSGAVVTEFTVPAKLTTLNVLGIKTLTTLKFATYEKDGKQVNDLETIAASAFSGLTDLTSVEIEKCTSLTEIPTKAFEKTGIREITLPYGITTIGISAFENSTSLSKFNVITSNGKYVGAEGAGYSTLKKIGDYAFRYTALEKFVFPTLESGSLELGANLFEGCFNLTDLTISASVSNIGAALNGAPSLENIDVDEGSDVIIDTANRLLLAKDGNHYVISSAFSAVPLDKDGTFKVPGTYNDGLITEIGAKAFEGQNAVKKMVVPASITTIGNQAFAQCLSLVTVEFADNALLTSIGNSVFANTYSLDTIKFPNSLRSMGASVFDRSQVREVTMPNEMTTIGATIFTDCHRLESLYNFPKITEGGTVGASFFNYCYALKNVTFAEGSDTVYDQMFKYCPALEEIDLTGITKVVGTQTFYYDCSSLRVVTLDAEFTSLPQRMFYSPALETIYRSDKLAAEDGETYREQNKGKVDISQVTSFPTITSDSNRAFYNCTAIKEIDARSVSAFSQYTFAGLTGLQKITISGSVTSLSTNLFKGCTSLKTIKYWNGEEEVGNDNEVTLPANLEFLGSSTSSSYCAFYNTAIEKITIPEGVKKIGKDANTAGISDSSYTFSGCTSLREVVLPSGITHLGAYVFNGCTALEIVTYTGAPAPSEEDKDKPRFELPASLTSVGNYCFDGCSALKTVDVSNVTTFGTYVFRNCTALEEATGIKATNTYMFQNDAALERVTLASSLTELSNYMFQNCTALKTINLGNITSIGTYVFQNDAMLEAVDLSKAESIGNYAFDGCTNLGAVASTSPDADGELVAGPIDLSAATAIGTYAFRNCTMIQAVNNLNKPSFGTYAFSGCTSLERIDLSKVTSFGTYAFQGCTALQAVDLSAASTMQTYLFDGCTSLTQVTLGDNIKTLANYMFANCTSLESINLNKVTTSGTYTFQNCTALETVTLGDLKSLGNYLFNGCTALQTINGLDKATAIGDYTFQGCTSLTILTFGACTIGANAFQGCVNLMTADLSSVTSIGTYAFQGCGSLTAANLSSATSIGADAFYNCSLLASVTLSSSLKAINNETFLNCYSLTELYIPASVTSIGGNLFVGCTDLTITVDPASTTFATNAQGVLYNKTNGNVLFLPYNAADEEGNGITEVVFETGTSLTAYMFNGYSSITKVVLPSDLTEIAAYAFWNFKGSLGADFVIPSGVKTIGNYAFYNMPNLNELDELVIPEGVTSIGQYAFANSTIKKITLPATLTSIGTYAFSGCEQLTEVVIPEGIKTINTRAFQNCTGLTKITLPSTLTLIDTYAFYDCTNLVDVIFSGDKVGGDTGLTIGNYSFQNTTSLGKVVLPEGTIKVSTTTTESAAAFKGSGIKSLTIPSTLTALNSYAFKNCAELKEVIFPATLSKDGFTIGTYAFDGCTALESVTFPTALTGETGISLGNYSFRNTGLKSLTLTSVITKLSSTSSNYTFANCEQLTQLTLEEGFALLGQYMFQNCTALTSVTIPSTVTSIGNSAFANCSSLASVTLTEGVTSIGTNVFQNCKALTTLKLNEGLATIGNYAFDNLPLLTALEIPYTVTSIGQSNFTGSKSLVVTFQETPEGVEEVGLTIGAAATSTSPDDTYTYIDEFGVGFKSMFAGNTAMTTFVAPSRLVAIGTYMFVGSSITSVKLNEGLATIGDGAFMRTALTSVEIPYTVKTIGKSAFGACENLATVTFQDTPEGVDAIALSFSAGGSSTSLSAGHVYYNEGDNKYYAGAFAANPKLTTIAMPSRTSSMGSYAFVFSGLEKIDLPADMTSDTGTYTFIGCSKMKEIIIPFTVFIGNYSFDGWTADQKVLIDITGAELKVMKSTYNTFLFRGTHATFGVINRADVQED